AVDTTRREVFFEQDIAGELDLPRLREALQVATPFVVSADVLKEQSERAAFFRGVLHRRIEEANAIRRASAGASEQAGEPRRVLIVVSPPYEFNAGSRVLPLELARGDVRIYHLRSYVGGRFFYSPSPSASRRRGFPREGTFSGQVVADEIERFFDGLEARRFELETPMDFRRALAAILADLRAM
ncbi:MAG TPA: hypothetical protein VNL38_02185, partial [Candidatus Nitrosotenuis sp.]|nr:hypothetical protein [Candidatus Nitrosotenuis sp.]